MRGFFDATCVKCRRRFGWAGSLADQPPCPHCGWKPTLTENDKKALKAFEQCLEEKDDAKKKDEQ